MECREVRHLLDEYLERVLSEEQMLAVDHHLHECDGCRQELAELRNFFRDLDHHLLQDMVLNEPSPLPADFTDQVMERVMAERPTGVNVIWPWLRRKWSRRQVASVAYAMSATAVVVSAGELLYLWNQTTDRVSLWTDQAAVYTQAAEAHLGAVSAYLTSLWQALLQLLQIG